MIVSNSNAGMSDVVEKSDLMVKQSLWPSIISAQLAATHLKECVNRITQNSNNILFMREFTNTSGVCPSQLPITVPHQHPTDDATDDAMQARTARAHWRRRRRRPHPRFNSHQSPKYSHLRRAGLIPAAPRVSE